MPGILSYIFTLGKQISARCTHLKYGHPFFNSCPLCSNLNPKKKRTYINDYRFSIEKRASHAPIALKPGEFYIHTAEKGLYPPENIKRTKYF